DRTPPAPVCPRATHLLGSDEPAGQGPPGQRATRSGRRERPEAAPRIDAAYVACIRGSGASG
ncbi:MAG: hypothetical protein AAF663_10565, partial [Planctomycetota bacterium]